MSDPQGFNAVNSLCKADRYRKNEDTIDNRPEGIGWGPRGMRRGGWTGYGVYWGPSQRDQDHVEERQGKGNAGDELRLK